MREQVNDLSNVLQGLGVDTISTPDTGIDHAGIEVPAGPTELALPVKRPKFLSPTALGLYEKDPMEYYRLYLLGGARQAQTPPMAVGSAFDAMVKSRIAADIFGKSAAESMHLGYREIFESQVEPHNHTVAHQDGSAVFGVYVSSGAYAELMMLLKDCSPQLDLTLQHMIEGDVDGVTGFVPLHGKPDLVFDKSDIRIILDWKVNGFYSNKCPSPAKGYAKCFAYSGPPKAYKIFSPQMVGPVSVNGAMTLDESKIDWADQLVTYQWTLDKSTKPSKQTIYLIEQLLVNKANIGAWRIAQFRSRVTEIHGRGLFSRYHKLWNVLQQDNEAVRKHFADLCAGGDVNLMMSTTGADAAGGALASGREI